MSTATSTSPDAAGTPATGPARPEIVHLTCCDPSTALCGEDVSDHRDMPTAPDPDTCAMCVHIHEHGACPVCGT